VNSQNIDVSTLLEIVQSGGIIALLIVIIYGGSKNWWVFGWQYRKQVEETEWWKNVCVRLLNISESAIEKQKENE